MIRKRIPVFLWILFPVILYGSSPRIVEINTRHFTLTYPHELSAAGLDVACRAESAITLFINFFQYEPSGRISLHVSAPPDAGIDSGNIIPSIRGAIKVEATDDPDFSMRLYASVFDGYMKFFSGNFNGTPGLTGEMISGLMEYIIHGISDESVMLLNDYALNRQDLKNRIGSGGRGLEELTAVTSGFFWDYLVNAYGKDAAAHSIKDSAYFGGFSRSLCRVTGKDMAAITGGFGLYLERYIKQVNAESYAVMADFDQMDYTALSHCCIGDGSSYALLAERDGAYYLLSTRDDKESFSAVKIRCGDFKLNSITGLGENIIISGYDRYGSVLICCDSTGRVILWEKKLPCIYINCIHADSTGAGIFFSARVKGKSSLFIYDMKSVRVLKTENDGIDLLYPAQRASGEVIYVRHDTSWSIMLLDQATGSGIELYRSVNTIGYPVEIPGGRILFSESVNGVTDIRSIDSSSGAAGQVTVGSTSSMHPMVRNGRLVFLNFAKNRYSPVYHPSYLK